MNSSSSLEQFTLGQDLRAPRLWTGMWQLSSNAWGTASAAGIRTAMAKCVDSGYNAFGGLVSPKYRIDLSDFPTFIQIW